MGSGTKGALSQRARRRYGPAVPLLRTLDLVLLLSLLIIAVSLVPASQQMLRLYLGIKNRRMVDATDWAPAPPLPVVRLADRLAKMGFSPIGVRSASLFGNRRRFEWNFTGEPTTTYISLLPAPAVAGGVLMVCHTAFRDGAVVATYFPTGVQEIRERLLAESTDKSPEAAVALHNQAVIAFSSLHGDPLENLSMADLLQHDATYRRLQAGAKLRSRTYAYVGMAIVVAMACGITLARLILLEGQRGGGRAGGGPTARTAQLLPASIEDVRGVPRTILM